MYRRLRFYLIFILGHFFFAISPVIGDNDSSPSDKAASAAIDSSHTAGWSAFNWFPDDDIITVLFALIVFFLAFILIIYLRQPLLSLSDHHPRYSRLLKQTISIFLVTFWILIIYITVQKILELTDTSSLIILGVIGLAIALAFLDILKDVIAGLILPFQKHLETGCKIGCSDFWGEIIRFGLREVEIKKSDGAVAIIPTSVILKERLIEIYSEKENCPVKLDFYFPLDIDIQKISQLAYKSAIVSPYLFLKKPASIFIMTELTNGHLLIKLTLHAFLQKIDFQPLFVNDMTLSLLPYMK
jgi:small-conductance mechanosensitive channel